MKKDELIDAIAGDAGMTKRDVERVIDGLGEVASAALAGGDEIVLPGLGKFKTKTRAARNGRNPHTGEPLQIPAKTVVDFKVAKALADRVA
jgi:DNA-binding protein HU-beta